MSKRARKAAEGRLVAMLEAEYGPDINALKGPSPAEVMREQALQLRRQAAELRILASRGMKPKAYPKKAVELEARASELGQTAAKMDAETARAAKGA
jgi:hypothetical protein